MRGWDPDEVPDLVYMDKPRHTEFRNLAARSFTPRAMRALEVHLASYADPIHRRVRCVAREER